MELDPLRYVDSTTLPIERKQNTGSFQTCTFQISTVKLPQVDNTAAYKYRHSLQLQAGNKQA